MRFLLVLMLIGLCLPAFAGDLESKSYDQYLDAAALELNDLNYEDIVGETALHRAAGAGDIKAIKEMIADGAQTMPYDIDGQSPIYYAIASGEDDTAFYLIQYVEDFYYDQDFLGRGVFDFAEELTDSEFLDNLSGGYELFHHYIKENDFEDALSKAISNGNINILRYLINYIELDPFYINQYKESLLHMAAKSGNLELINYIISLFNGEKPLFINILGQTPLHIAVEYDFTEAINPIAEVNLDQLFVFSGFYAPTSTPFKLALKRENEEIKSTLRSFLHDFYEVENKFNNVRAMLAYSEIFQDSKDATSSDLIDAIKSGIDVAPYYSLYAGADPSKVTQGDVVSNSTLSDTANAFHISARLKDFGLIETMSGSFKGDINLLSYSGHNVFSYLIEANSSIEDVNKLIELGANPEIGKNPMEQAIKLNNIEILNLLIDKNVSVHQLGDKNSSMLLIAAQENNFEAINRLLSLGADPLHANDEGDTALHLAAKHASIELFMSLAEKVASLEIKNKNHKAPLDIAISKERKDIVAYLLANVNDLRTSFWRLESALLKGMFDLATALVKNGEYNLDTIVSGQGWSLLHDFVNKYEKSKYLNAELIDKEEEILSNAIKFLIDNGATLDFKDRYGKTPLHHAVLYDNYKLTELLLKLGSNPDMKSNKKKNAVKLAKSKSIYKLLKTYGASGKRLFF